MMSLGSRKGQVTLFIILGIVGLLIISLLAYAVLKSSQAQAENIAQFNIEAQNIERFVDTCLQTTAYKGLATLGRNGGYIEIPGVIGLNNAALWYLDEVNIQPTLNETLKQLEEYVNQQLPICANFSSFESQGFSINAIAPNSKVLFGIDNVVVEASYPLEIRKGNFLARYGNFSTKYNVRFRKAFELASQIINKELEPNFKFSNPLDNVTLFDFDVAYFSPADDALVYVITDKTRMENGENFKLIFANQLKQSDLKRTVNLQKNSATVPTTLPYIVYSVDRRAELNILPNTTFNLNGKNADNISVQQFYPKNITREHVPFNENADDSVTYGSLTWVMTYPVYEFLPTGLNFSRPERLVLYWDEDRIPRQGNMGILYNEGQGWRPLPSKADYTQNYIYTDIPGFSNYTAVDCGVQPAKNTSAMAQQNPGAACWVKLIVIIIILIIMIALIVLTFGAASAAVPAVANGMLTMPEMAAATTSTASAVVTASGSAAMASAGGALGTLGVASTALFTGALTGLGMAIVLVGGIVGGVYLNSAFAYSTQKDTVVFTPTCDQSVTIHQDLSQGEGKCVPSGTKNVKAGIPQPVVAKLTKCKGLRSFVCGSCSLKCSTSYK